MEKKKYITPEMLVRRITPHANIMVPVSDTTYTHGNYSKQGNGFSWDDAQGNGSDDDSDEGNW